MFDQAKIYSNAGSTVHMYNFNLDLEYDWLTTRELTEVKGVPPQDPYFLKNGQINRVTKISSTFRPTESDSISGRF